MVLRSISGFALSETVLEKTVAIVATYTPLSPEQIITSDFSLNRRIVGNYVASVFTRSLDNDLKIAFGQCAEGSDANDEVTTIQILADRIRKDCHIQDSQF